MVTMKKIRLANPQKSGRGRRRSNPGLLTMGLVNPQRKRGSMATKTKKRNPPRRHNTSHSKKRRPNPFMGFGKKAAPRRRRRSNPAMVTTRRRRRRNPNFLTGGVDMLKQGLFALVGLVVTRQVPQMVLQANNTSWMGYAANIITALAVGYFGHSALGPQAGNAMMLGGGLYTANRIINDNFSSVGQYLSLSGMGDPMAMGPARRGMRGIVPGYFPLPVPTDAQNNPIIPAEIRALPAPTPAAAATYGQWRRSGACLGRCGSWADVGRGLSFGAFRWPFLTASKREKKR